MFEDCYEDGVDYYYTTSHIFKEKENIPLKLWAEHFKKPEKERNSSMSFIFEKEFIRLKGMYCFLTESQVLGKTLTKFGIPNVCGKILKKFLQSKKYSKKTSSFEKENKKYLSKPPGPTRKNTIKSSTQNRKFYQDNLVPRYPPIVERWSDAALRKFKENDDKDISSEEAYSFFNDKNEVKLSNLKDKNESKRLEYSSGKRTEQFANSPSSRLEHQQPNGSIQSHKNKGVVKSTTPDKSDFVEDIKVQRNSENQPTSASINKLKCPQQLELGLKVNMKKTVRFNDNDLCTFAPTQEFSQKELQPKEQSEKLFEEFIKNYDDSTLPKKQILQKEHITEIVIDLRRTKGQTKAYEQPSIQDIQNPSILCDMKSNDLKTETLNISHKEKAREESPFEIEPYSENYFVIEESSSSASSVMHYKKSNLRNTVYNTKPDSSINNKTQEEKSNDQNAMLCDNSVINRPNTSKCVNQLVINKPLTGSQTSPNRYEKTVIEETPSTTEETIKQTEDDMSCGVINESMVNQEILPTEQQQEIKGSFDEVSFNEITLPKSLPSEFSDEEYYVLSDKEPSIESSPESKSILKTQNNLSVNISSNIRINNVEKNETTMSLMKEPQENLPNVLKVEALSSNILDRLSNGSPSNSLSDREYISDSSHCENEENSKASPVSFSIQNKNLNLGKPTETDVIDSSSKANYELNVETKHFSRERTNSFFNQQVINSSQKLCDSNLKSDLNVKYPHVGDVVSTKNSDALITPLDGLTSQEQALKNNEENSKLISAPLKVDKIQFSSPTSDISKQVHEKETLRKNPNKLRVRKALFPKQNNDSPSNSSVLDEINTDPKQKYCLVASTQPFKIPKVQKANSFQLPIKTNFSKNECLENGNEVSLMASSEMNRVETECYNKNLQEGIIKNMNVSPTLHKAKMSESLEFYPLTPEELSSCSKSMNNDANEFDSPENKEHHYHESSNQINSEIQIGNEKLKASSSKDNLVVVSSENNSKPSDSYEQDDYPPDKLTCHKALFPIQHNVSPKHSSELDEINTNPKQKYCLVARTQPLKIVKVRKENSFQSSTKTNFAKNECLEDDHKVCLISSEMDGAQTECYINNLQEDNKKNTNVSPPLHKAKMSESLEFYPLSPQELSNSSKSMNNDPNEFDYRENKEQHYLESFNLIHSEIQTGNENLKASGLKSNQEVIPSENNSKSDSAEQDYYPPTPEPQSRGINFLGKGTKLQKSQENIISKSHSEMKIDEFPVENSYTDSQVNSDKPVVNVFSQNNKNEENDPAEHDYYVLTPEPTHSCDKSLNTNINQYSCLENKEYSKEHNSETKNENICLEASRTSKKRLSLKKGASKAKNSSGLFPLNSNKNSEDTNSTNIVKKDNTNFVSEEKLTITTKITKAKHSPGLLPLNSNKSSKDTNSTGIVKNADKKFVSEDNKIITTKNCNQVSKLRLNNNMEPCDNEHNVSETKTQNRQEPNDQLQCKINENNNNIQLNKDYASDEYTPMSQEYPEGNMEVCVSIITDQQSLKTQVNTIYTQFNNELNQDENETNFISENSQKREDPFSTSISNKDSTKNIKKRLNATSGMKIQIQNENSKIKSSDQSLERNDEPLTDQAPKINHVKEIENIKSQKIDECIETKLSQMVLENKTDSHLGNNLHHKRIVPISYPENTFPSCDENEASKESETLGKAPSKTNKTKVLADCLATTQDGDLQKLKMKMEPNITKETKISRFQEKDDKISQKVHEHKSMCKKSVIVSTKPFSVYPTLGTGPSNKTGEESMSLNTLKHAGEVNHATITPKIAGFSCSKTFTGKENIGKIASSSPITITRNIDPNNKTKRKVAMKSQEVLNKISHTTQDILLANKTEADVSNVIMDKNPQSTSKSSHNFQAPTYQPGKSFEQTDILPVFLNKKLTSLPERTKSTIFTSIPPINICRVERNKKKDSILSKNRVKNWLSTKSSIGIHKQEILNKDTIKFASTSKYPIVTQMGRSSQRMLSSPVRKSNKTFQQGNGLCKFTNGSLNLNDKYLQSLSDKYGLVPSEDDSSNSSKEEVRSDDMISPDGGFPSIDLNKNNLLVLLNSSPQGDKLEYCTKKRKSDFLYNEIPVSEYEESLKRKIRLRNFTFYDELKNLRKQIEHSDSDVSMESIIDQEVDKSSEQCLSSKNSEVDGGFSSKALKLENANNALDNIGSPEDLTTFKEESNYSSTLRTDSAFHSLDNDFEYDVYSPSSEKSQKFDDCLASMFEDEDSSLSPPPAFKSGRSLDSDSSQVLSSS